MPFNVSILEIVIMVASLGGMAAVVYGVVRLVRRLDGGVVGRGELEAEKRRLERRIEALEERNRLPKG